MSSSFVSFIELPFNADHNAPTDADNLDQYPESLVEHVIENYTKQGDKVFDPFIGYGTTAFVAEELGRVPFGIEADGVRYEWCAGQVEHWQNIFNEDAGDVTELGLPKMDFCLTSPPYMQMQTKWNPLYGGDPEFSGYENYLVRMGEIFGGIASVMKRGAMVMVHVDNLPGKRFTPLAADFHRVISEHLRPHGEIVVRWTGDRPEYYRDYNFTRLLVFKKV